MGQGQSSVVRQYWHIRDRYHRPVGLTNTRVLTSTEMDGVNFEQSKNGIKEWFLTASRLYSTENDSDMKLEDVNALFFGTAGENKETTG